MLELELLKKKTEEFLAPFYSEVIPQLKGLSDHQWKQYHEQMTLYLAGRYAHHGWLARFENVLARHGVPEQLAFAMSVIRHEFSKEFSTRNGQGDMTNQKFKVGDRVLAPKYQYNTVLTVAWVNPPDELLDAWSYGLHGIEDTFFYASELRPSTTEREVILWARNRDLVLHTKAQALKQWAKTQEELGEFIVERHGTDNKEQTKLEAGDILVTLAIQLAIHRLDNALTQIMSAPMQPLGTLDDITDEIEEKLKRYAPLTPNIEIHCSRLVGWLQEAIAPYGLDLEECFAASLEKIRDRKGKTVDGVFVKEEDL